jgi:hypothetical protein
MDETSALRLVSKYFPGSTLVTYCSSCRRRPGLFRSWLSVVLCDSCTRWYGRVDEVHGHQLARGRR